MENKLQQAEKAENHSHHGLWKILGGTALVLTVACVVANLPDIKRYIRIVTM